MSEERDEGTKGRRDEGGELRSRGTIVARAVAMALICAGGCAGPPKPDAAAPPPETAAPTWAELARAQNARVEKLARFHGDGVVEIRWVEEGRARMLQADLELWTRLPADTALQVTKLGEPLLWLGSDAQEYWLFDLRAEEKTLITAAHETELSAFGPGLIAVRPLSLLDLMGLVRLPEDAPGAIAWDGEHGGWRVGAVGAAGSVEIVFDPDGLLPIRVESGAGQDRAALYATLRRYEPVTIEGVNRLAWPRMAEVVSVHDPGQEGGVSVFLDGMDGVVSDRTIDRLVDKQRLIRHHQPDVTRTDRELSARRAE